MSPLAPRCTSSPPTHSGGEKPTQQRGLECCPKSRLPARPRIDVAPPRPEGSAPAKPETNRAKGVCKGVRRLDSATRRATTRRRVCPVVGAASPSWVSLTARRRRVSLRGRAVVLAALTASGGTGRSRSSARRGLAMAMSRTRTSRRARAQKVRVAPPSRVRPPQNTESAAAPRRSRVPPRREKVARVGVKQPASAPLPALRPALQPRYTHKGSLARERARR